MAGFPWLSGRVLFWVVPAFALAFFLGLEYSGSGGGHAPVARDVKVVELAGERTCDPTLGTCRAVAGKVGVGLRLGPDVHALEPFAARVQVQGIAPATVDGVRLEFVMRDMDMGQNRYRLLRQRDGAWRGRITLPVCSSGRVDWEVAVRVAAGKTAYTAHFPFEIR